MNPVVDGAELEIGRTAVELSGLHAGVESRQVGTDCIPVGSWDEVMIVDVPNLLSPATAAEIARSAASVPRSGGFPHAHAPIVGRRPR